MLSEEEEEEAEAAARPRVAAPKPSAPLLEAAGEQRKAMGRGIFFGCTQCMSSQKKLQLIVF